jgi:hypothetical protein
VVVGAAWPGALWAVLAYSVLWWCVQVAVARRRWLRSEFHTPERARLVEFLRGCPPSRLLGFDNNVMWDLAYETAHEHFMISPRQGSVARHLSTIFSRYPYTRYEALELLESQLLVVNWPALARAAQLGVEPRFPLDDMPKIYDEGGYAVFHCAPEARLSRAAASLQPVAART